jgi:hypothetical protein
MVEHVGEQAARFEARPASLRRHGDADALDLGVVYELADGGTRERITSRYLIEHVLRIQPDRVTAEHGKQLGMAMRKHRWQGPKGMRFGGQFAKGYWRNVLAAGNPWD